MQALLLSVLICGVVCFSATEIEHRLEKLKFLVREQLQDTKVLVQRVTVLKRNITDLALLNKHASIDKEAESEHDDRENGQAALSELYLNMDRISKRKTDEHVAFHAYLGTSQTYNTHELFKFDKPSLNVRGAYTPDDGIFNVPVGGLYVFTWTVTVPESGGKIVTELVVHGHVKGVIMCDSDDNLFSGSGLHPSTAVVVTRVNIGDNVYIRMRQAVGSRMNVLSSDSNVRTTFSGWLLF